jgi:hypothetical protein
VADFIKVDSDQLNNNAETLRRDAHAMQEFFSQVYGALSKHDPSKGGGDDVGKAIGIKYFENANQLLHAAGISALLLLDIADLATKGAANAQEVELWLEKINRDLSLGDSKLPLTPGPFDGAGGNHRR